MAGSLLQPGEDIKPHTNIAEITLLLRNLYGISQCRVQEMEGYDDKNYHVRVSNPSTTITNPHLSLPSSPTVDFVLKVTNSLDSRTDAQFDAHLNVMRHLLDAGWRVQAPLKNVSAEYHSLQTFGSSKHMVRLLTYLPGELLKSIPLTNDIAYKLGHEVARLALALKNFHHEFYTSYRSIWMLSELHRLSSFLFVLNDPSRVHIVEKVMAEFQNKVISKLNTFEQGVIHGDINEQNILVTLDPTQTPREQFSILDFGDSQHSCLIFDLAIAITYMVLQSKHPDTGGYMLAGYSKVRKIPYAELDILQICIMARLCQSLVLGLYTYQKQGSANPYVLGTQDAGWALLETLDKYETKDLIKKWTQIGRDLENFDQED